MELLWHVDERDIPLGAVERSRAHVEGMRHRSGVVLLLDPVSRLYLTQRAATKAIFPARYDTSASFHVAWGESYLEAAQREAREELGLDLPLQYLGKFAHDDPPESQFVAVFTMHHDGRPIVLDPDEARAGGFYPDAELERIVRMERCTPWLAPALRLWRAAHEG